jgi:flagellar biosynthesis/type III secretory pathway protein FliH
MALIKNAKSDRLVRDAIVLDMGDLARQAERMLSAARRESDEISASARVEAQRLIDSADARGHVQGLERGLLEGRQAGEAAGRAEALRQWLDRIAQLTQAWSEALAGWESNRATMHQQACEDVIAFALALARKVVMRMPQSDPTIVRDQLAAALAMVSRPTAIEIRVHPADRALAEQVLPDLMESLKECAHASVAPDASMTPGGCIVMTAGGRVDASIETQLERIAEALVPGPPVRAAGDRIDEA